MPAYNAERPIHERPDDLSILRREVLVEHRTSLSGREPRMATIDETTCNRDDLQRRVDRLPGVDDTDREKASTDATCFPESFRRMDRSELQLRGKMTLADARPIAYLARGDALLVT